MSRTEILEELRRMPELERRELVATIDSEFGSGSDELTPEQIAEVERRAAEARAHPERGIPWTTLRAELFSRYGVKP